MKMRQSKSIFFFFVLLHVFFSIILSCSKESSTIQLGQEIADNPLNPRGTVYPQIQLINPGGLQTLASPQPVVSGVSPDNPGIVVVFTRSMENSSGELASWVQLYQGGSPVAGVTATSNSTNSAVVLTPTGALAGNTVYTIRISSSAYIDNYPTLTMNYDNLVAIYGALSPSSPSYVEYAFQTGTTTPADITTPTLVSTNPANLTTAQIDLSGSGGYINIIFNDNNSPVIDPTTVNDATITLEDSLFTPISGSVIIDYSDATFATYRFYPDAALSYSETYTLTLTNGIKDMAGNLFTGTTRIFYTAAENAPVIDYWDVTGIAATSATIAWATDRNSIKHLDVEAGTVFPGVSYTSPPDVHDTGLPDTYFTHTATGLTANTAYSFMISAHTDTSVTSAGPFDTTQTVNYAFRTLPDTTEGASGNYQLAVSNSTKSNLLPVQISQDYSFIFWKDGTSIYGQYLNTSAGAPDTWDKWPDTTTNTGSQVFSAAGSLDAVYNGNDGAIVTRTDTSIYSDSIYNNGGALGRHWTGGLPGVTVYNGGTADNARGAVSYSGYGVNVIASGASDIEYVYDSDSPFASAGAGDYLINDTAYIARVAITNKIDNNFIELGGRIITSGNLNYHVSDSAPTITGQITCGVFSAVQFCGNTNYNISDVVYNTTDQSMNFGVGYIFAILPNSPVGFDTYTLDRAIGLNVSGDSYSIYPGIVAGIAETNVLYDAGTDFSAAIVGDIVVNLSDGHYEEVAAGGTVYAANGLLILTEATWTFLFPNDNTNYLILNLDDNADFVTAGMNTGYSVIAPYTFTQNLRDFSADGAAIGDILYNVDTAQYAEIIAVGTTTVTLSTQIFTANNQRFVIYSCKDVTYAWMESNNISGKTVRLDNGTPILPDTATATSFTITDSANNCRYPYVISSLRGDVIVIYELANGANWDIRAKKIDGAGNIIWGGIATADGTALVTNQTAKSSTGRLIIRAINDNSGGAWVLYENNTSTAGVCHINSTGIVNGPYTIATAESPDFVLYTGTNIAVAYEDYITVGSDTVKRLRVSRYGTAGFIATHNVRSADQSYSQINPRIINDGGGGFIVSWLETKYYPSVYYSLFAQHFNSAFTGVYGNDRFVAIPMKDDQSEDPYLIDHTIIRYNDSAAPNAGVFFWLDERSANLKDIYFQPVAD